MSENIRNVINRLPETQLGWSHPIMSQTCPPRFGCYGVLACKWTDWDATLVVASRHVPSIGNAITPLTMGPIGMTLGWSHPSNTSAAKPFPWYLVVTANRTVNVLVL